MEISEFDQNRYLSLATFRKSGVAVETPVWFAAMDGKLYVISAGDSGKVKRLRNSPNARISPCDMRGRIKGPARETRARIVDAPALVDRALGALTKKYGWQMQLTNFVARVSGRMQKRAYLEIDF
jgi:PPOX class probable F420-dependent enzyme